MTNLVDVFTDLRAIMIPFARKLDCVTDQDDELLCKHQTYYEKRQTPLVWSCADQKALC